MGEQQIGHILPKTEIDKMADRVIKVFSDLSVQDHAIHLVAGITATRANPIVLARIVLYNKELERYRKEMNRPIYNRRNYVQQDILY